MLSQPSTLPGGGLLSGPRSRTHVPLQEMHSMGSAPPPDRQASRWTVLTLSTIAFTLMFNVWLMLGVLAPKIKETLGLSPTQVEWLIAASILSGALLRLNFGIWADRYGGRNVMVALMLLTIVPTYLSSHAQSYWQLLVCAVFYGLAGNAFTAGGFFDLAPVPPPPDGFPPGG